MIKDASPYKAHVFLCAKTRDGERKSCGAGDNPDLKTLLKDEVKKRGLKPHVRISDSGCLGVCEAGPNIMIYPQKIWLSAVTTDDLPEIVALLESLVSERV